MNTRSRAPVPENSRHAIDDLCGLVIPVVPHVWILTLKYGDTLPNEPVATKADAVVVTAVAATLQYLLK